MDLQGLHTGILSFFSLIQRCLEGWAKQGVLLLNAVLTVEAHKAASHAGRGWELFTNAIIKLVAERNDHVVFMLWGNHAQKKAECIQNV